MVLFGKKNTSSASGSFASLLKNSNNPSSTKAVRLTKVTNSEAVHGANVAIPLTAVEGKNDYARALIEVSSLNPMKDSVVVAIPFSDGSGHSLETVEIEYEWTPPWCETCKIFDHDNKECPKNVKVQAATVEEADGFTKVTRKNGKKKQNMAKQVAGIKFSKPKVNFYKVVEKQPNKEGSGSSNPIPDKPMEYPKQKDLLLSIHKHYVRDRPWCILGDFNVSLSADESSSGSSRIYIGMRDFQECVDMIEVTDVNSMGLRFTWNQKPKGEDGNIHDNVIKLHHELDEVQKSLDRDPSNVELRDEEAAYLKAFQDAIIDEERIDSITIMDGNIVDGDQVPLAFINHYSTFLGQPGIMDLLELNDLLPNRLSVGDAESMVRDVTNDEIKEALFSLGVNKALGPDGFSAAFFKETWDIISDDVCKAIKEFFTNGILLKELNHTITALIPKVAAPLRVNDFRLISCCNFLFKCISKIISNRIKGSLADLVSPNQSAFVPGRRILDNILLTQELMYNYHVDRGPARCAFKVDIQKAYDTMDWDFLKNILIGFGFHMRMVG
nr:hypothetical protein [Tanacetum cinerariifolium]GEV60443.1 hypothetical protein [Tanacetum cinerariifolium]